MNRSQTMCYTSSDLLLESTCEQFPDCSDISFELILMPTNDSDPVVTLQDNREAQVVVQTSSLCICNSANVSQTPQTNSTPPITDIEVPPSSNVDIIAPIIIAASVLALIVTILVVTVLILYYYRKRNHLGKQTITEE